MMLECRNFLVQEQVEFIKLTDRYDIYDSESGVQLGFAQETISDFAKLLRLVHKNLRSLIPTTIVVREDENSEPILTIKRPMALLRTKVHVIDRNQAEVGYFQRKLLTLGRGFTIHNPSGKQIADVKGDWTGWDFKLLNMKGKELGRVDKQWGTGMRDFFTSTSDGRYFIKLNRNIDINTRLTALLLAAGLAIDIVFYQNQ